MMKTLLGLALIVAAAAIAAVLLYGEAEADKKKFQFYEFRQGPLAGKVEVSCVLETTVETNGHVSMTLDCKFKNKTADALDFIYCHMLTLGEGEFVTGGPKPAKRVDVKEEWKTRRDTTTSPPEVGFQKDPKPRARTATNVHFGCERVKIAAGVGQESDKKFQTATPYSIDNSENPGKFAAKLTQAMDASTTTVKLTDPGGIKDGDTIIIDDEQMKVTAGGGTDTLTVDRAQGGTTAGTHQDESEASIPLTATEKQAVQNEAKKAGNWKIAYSDAFPMIPGDTFIPEPAMPGQDKFLVPDVGSPLAADITDPNAMNIEVETGGLIAKGDLIYIDLEVMRVKSVDPTGTMLTVDRGVMGTSRATHSKGTPVRNLSVFWVVEDQPFDRIAYFRWQNPAGPSGETETVLVSDTPCLPSSFPQDVASLERCPAGAPTFSISTPLNLFDWFSMSTTDIVANTTEAYLTLETVGDTSGLTVTTDPPDTEPPTIFEIPAGQEPLGVLTVSSSPEALFEGRTLLATVTVHDPTTGATRFTENAFFIHDTEPPVVTSRSALWIPGGELEARVTAFDTTTTPLAAELWYSVDEGVSWANTALESTSELFEDLRARTFVGATDTLPEVPSLEYFFTVQDTVGNVTFFGKEVATPSSCIPVDDGITDTDADGFTDTLEIFMGTDPCSPCPTTGDDAWSPDRNQDGVVTISDVLATKPSFGTEAGDPNYNPRSDLTGDSRVTIADILALKPFFNKGCNDVIVVSWDVSPDPITVVVPDIPHEVTLTGIIEKIGLPGAAITLKLTTVQAPDCTGSWVAQAGDILSDGGNTLTTQVTLDSENQITVNRNFGFSCEHPGPTSSSYQIEAIPLSEETNKTNNTGSVVNTVICVLE